MRWLNGHLEFKKSVREHQHGGTFTNWKSQTNRTKHWDTCCFVSGKKKKRGGIRHFLLFATNIYHQIINSLGRRGLLPSRFFLRISHGFLFCCPATDVWQTVTPRRPTGEVCRCGWAGSGKSCSLAWGICHGEQESTPSERQRYGKINDLGNSWKSPKRSLVGGPSYLQIVRFLAALALPSWGSCRIRGFPEESQEVSAARRQSGKIWLVSCGIGWEAGMDMLSNIFKVLRGFRTPGRILT